FGRVVRLVDHVCLSYYVPLRDLLSFPTRRSSDLVHAEVLMRNVEKAGIRRVRARLPVLCSRRRGADLPSHLPLERRLLAHVVRTDRKSTRLNSSHVKISYAVFCLKKKKETQFTFC